jgi:hypothetical protein
MDSPKQGLDLEKELTCSVRPLASPDALPWECLLIFRAVTQICTELLYQPLTLLDCLHTFCGSCLKEWFTYQANTIERSPEPPTPESAVLTCPSCRAVVRDTRHNATVATLLDMFIGVHPEKARDDSDKEEMERKFKPGDQVLPKIKIRQRTADERRADEADQRLIEEVREMSLRDVGGQPGVPPPLPPRGNNRRRDSRSRSTGDNSSEPRPRRPREGGHRSRPDEPGRRSSDQLHPESERRRRRSESRQRQVEHQSSLRSLISSADMSERDIDREIEEFARQIQEEGLLDGLDLDRIDLSRNDSLSRRITEAYRRRLRGRPRNQRARRSSHGGGNRPAETRSATDIRPPPSGPASRSSSRVQGQSRSASANGQGEDRSRPPPSSSATANVVDARDVERPRQRTASNGRSTTTPVFPSAPSNNNVRPASRSQTDLSLRTPPALDTNVPRTGANREVRSSSTPNVPAPNPPPVELPGSSQGNPQSFANRVPHGLSASGQQTGPTSAPSAPPPDQGATAGPRGTSARPAELATGLSAVTSPTSGGHGHQRSRSHLFPEPSITCAQCRRPHIEYQLHYNCHICADGQWNICLDCYRGGKGCLHWFGFGYGAWTKWENARQRGNGSLKPPHMLTASRYMPPVSQPGGADGRKTLTTDDPRNRLESGTFCAKCLVWTNDCYWRCDVCNEGDWGFCNNCVNQGKSCSHTLLPLTHEGTQGAHERPRSPRSPGRPQAASIFTGPSASSIGPFKPLKFTTRCDVCQDPIPPTQPRYHCFSCTSALVADATTGDYDICFSCYNNLVAHSEISYENGHSGWRRCLNGHRMAVIGFTEGKIGLWRYVERDLVGGRALRSETYESPDLAGQNLLKWSWTQGDKKWERLVTKDVKLKAPTSDGSTNFATTFPPDGGVGSRAVSTWSWFPRAEATDELMFPRGAEIREIEDVNGDWYFGTYMGAKGLFPAPYVRMDASVGEAPRAG